MGLRDLFRPGRGRGRAGTAGRPSVAADPADLGHLRDWAATRVGVDAFLEPATLVDPVGLCLVDLLGEWTRRPVGDERTARRLCDELGVQLHDVLVTGYPERMREFDRARLARRRREQRERLRGPRADGGPAPRD